MERPSHRPPRRAERPRPAVPADPLAAVRVALERRRVLLAPGSPTNSCRLVHDAADGLEGLVIEKLGDVLIVQCHEGRLELDEQTLRELVRAVMSEVGATAAYQKIFAKDRSAALSDLEPLHRDPQPWLGKPAPRDVAVTEGPLTLLARPYDGYSTGIFLEHRDNRARVRERAAGRNVLNLFAYTCGFSVAAALGGAVSTVSVDASRRYLEWGKENFGASERPLEGHWFFASDVFEFLRRAARKEQQFDLVLCDPPTFARLKNPHRIFALRKDLDRLLEGVLDLLAPGGELLLSCNHRETSLERLTAALTHRAADRGRTATITDIPDLPPDFAGDPGFAKSLWARVE